MNEEIELMHKLCIEASASFGGLNVKVTPPRDWVYLEEYNERYG